MQKQPYITPTITVVEFRSEKGYADSGVVSQDGLIELLNYENGSQETEVFSVHTGWDDESSTDNHFWN
jgi:hypothetical protein